jgi:hypothetical protein
MKLNGTEINVSQNLNVSSSGLTPSAGEATASLEQGFITGARQVHDAVGILLITYLFELGVWALAQKTEWFPSEEKASEFYIRVRRMLVTGRVMILLLLFFKTVFTFTSTTGGMP